MPVSNNIDYFIRIWGQSNENISNGPCHAVIVLGMKFEHLDKLIPILKVYWNTCGNLHIVRLHLAKSRFT